MGGITPLSIDPLAFNGTVGSQSASAADASSPSPSLLEQANAGLQQASQNFVPLSIPGVGSPDVNEPIIQGLPGDINSYVKKYTTNLPAIQQAVASGTISPEAVNAVQAYDANRVTHGQAPLNAKQTAGALSTVTTGQQATPEPNHSALDVFGNIHRDLSTIVNSIPHVIDPRTYIHEAEQLPQIPSDIAHASNPITGLLQAPGIRLIPGAYTLGNLAEGRSGIETLLTHPLMTGLDVAAANAGVGHLLATPEETAAAHLAGEKVTGGIGRALESTGLSEPYAGAKSQLKDAFMATKPGQYLDATFGQQARTFMMYTNQLGSQIRDGLDHQLKTGTALIDPEQVVTDISRSISDYTNKWKDVIPDARRAELATQVQLNPSNIPDITDQERAYITDYQHLQDRITNYHVGNGELAQLETNGQMETFPIQDANTIRKQWANRDRYEAGTMVRQAVRNPDLLTPDHLPVLASKVQDVLADDRFTGKFKAEVARGYGYAVRGINGTLPDGYLRAVADRRYQDASAMLADHQPTFDQPLTQREATLRSRYLTVQRKFTPARMARAAEIASNVEAETLPARWREWRDQLVQEKVTGKLQGVMDSDHVDYENLIRQVNMRNYARVVSDGPDGLLTNDDMTAFIKEASHTIAEMKTTTGESPLFVHRVEPQQVNAIKYGSNPAQGSLRGSVNTPSQLRGTPDVAKPYVHDLSVALGHEAQQLLHQKAQETLYGYMLRTEPLEGETVAPIARKYADLDKQYEGALRNRQFVNPTVDSRDLIIRRINQEWMKFPTERLTPELKTTLGLQDEMGENHPYIPRSIYRNLEELSSPHLTIFDPIMRVFRTALLPLSPRFLLYHMIGGAIQLAGQTDPLTVWKNLGDAAELVKNDGESAVAGRTAFPESMRPILGHILEPTQEWDWHAGGTVRRLLGKSPLAETATGDALANAADTAHNALGAVVNKSYGLVTFFQDTYRALGYLYGYDKSINAGMTAEQSVAAGEALARKTLLTWDNMTAIERTGMRSIFPFYGFAKHILNYAEKYPIDHPFRASVIASIGRNEQSDLGTGLPSTMLNMLFLGHPDNHGHVRAIMGGALNPFRDVANMTTLAGWLSATNPIISGLLQSAGLDTSSGGPDLYPNLQYDPDTGRLSAKSTNPLLNIVTQTVPQSQILLGMLNKSSEYKDLMRLDPSSAMRLIASQGGIPLVVEDQNVGKKQIQGEVTRETAAATAYDNALKTGDYSEAAKWPTVAPVLAQVQALKSAGALTQFLPGGNNSQQKLDQIAQMIGQVGQ